MMKKRNVTNTSFYLALAAALAAAPQAFASTGYGQRKVQAPDMVGAQVASAAPQTIPAFDPPSQQGVEWLRVPFDKAENEVLGLFQRDLPKVEDIADSLSIYEVRASGRLPQDYRRELRSKLERVLLTSKRLALKQCNGCEESRVYRTDSGDVKYESFSSELGRPAKIASELGVGYLLYTEMSYTPEDLQLRVRLVDASTGQLRWSKEYSTADVVKTREAMNDSGGPGEISESDSLAHVLIGEVAFTVVLSPGIGVLPTIDNGSGGGTAVYPSADLFMGEKFDRGRKVFGFLIGGAFTMGSTGSATGSSGTPLPWGLRLAPRFRYVFNPYNTTTARWSLAAETGAFISTGLATAYFGLGPEVSMINRFSVSFTPVYIVPGTVQGTQVNVQNDNGGFTNTGGTGAGTYGGLGMLLKASINW